MRVYFLPVFFVLLLSCQTEPNSAELINRRDALLQKSTRWLWSQQAEDGGWHSEVHGILKGGQAWTPYLFDALLDVPDSVFTVVPEQHDLALRFLRQHLDSVGVMGRSDPQVMEYPNYATSYTLRVLLRTGNAEDKQANQRILRYLQGQQFTEQRGINPEHPAYGAWGFGESNLPDGEVGHVDLSHIRRVLEALRLSGLPDDHPSYAKALIFLDRLQKRGEATFDGGFCASTYTLGTNKADAYDRPPCTSYASATADGVLALLATGLSLQDERVEKAKQWLLDHPRWDYPEGIPPNAPGQWGEVLFLYHLSVRAQAYASLGILGWEAELLDLLELEINKDGSFSNPKGAPNKENDPLLGTALVIRALCAMKFDE